MYNVACVGILVADIIAKPVQQIPEKGLLKLVDSIEMFTGGNAMTAAINIQRLGLSSAIVGKIGNDFLGDFLYDQLQKNGVCTKGLVRSSEAQTSASVALSDPSGERSFLHCTGTNAKFCFDDINMDVIKDSDIVFVTGSFLMDTFDGQQTADFLKLCKQLGKTTAVDVCWDSKNRWNAVMDPCLPYIDIFMPSIDEAKMIAGCEDPNQIADFFFSKGVQKVVIKLGSRGCYLRASKNDEAVILPAIQNVPVVDTTGAGDSFCSGFLAAYSLGKDFITCGKYGNAAGACNVSAKGATSGIKSMESIKKMMEEAQC